MPISQATAPRKLEENGTAHSCQDICGTGVLVSLEVKASILLNPLTFSGDELSTLGVLAV